MAVQTSPSTDIFVSVPHDFELTDFITSSPYLQYSGYRARFSRRFFLTSPYFRGRRSIIGTCA